MTSDKRVKEKKHILFVGEEVTLAHIVRPLLLADSLDRSKYNISFASGHKYNSLLENCGLSNYFLHTIQSEVFLDRLSEGKPLYNFDELKKYVEFELSCIAKLSPDLIVGDFRISLGVTADLLGIPYICLSNAHWSPYSVLPFPVPEHVMLKIFGIGMVGRLLPKLLPLIFWHHARSFNAVRNFYGLPSVGNLKNVYTYGTWTLYTDIPSVSPTKNLPQNHSYIGPVIWSPDIAPPHWWSKLPEDKHLIYITMGSSGDVRVLKKILEALKDTVYIGVVATAGRIKIEPSTNIFSADYLPGLDIVKKASLVLCNGGSATAYQALSQGVPVFGFPSNADQFYTMESIEKNGAGILIRPGHASSTNILRAINSLIQDDGYKAVAQKLAEEIAHYIAPKIFRSFIDNWADGNLKQ
ncbi:PGL/p-HBAD biosynthesis glycosyltransferase MRA_2985 [Candidatus Sulfobium mesophilum]|uniref:PGL/p-HBAD biosynthesis glycosyltransferase MRA_2985 n=1 Tax=Candidatus Sulfobium mesophilum TaxID=2016548 RepID=A0A2U3QDJ8_9BACT|nr:PGL/p-HBAD biosynthesis glycosyltransferase MRA_2985 [Candidatus Sulfobium mesophilum]